MQRNQHSIHIFLGNRKRMELKNVRRTEPVDGSCLHGCRNRYGSGRSFPFLHPRLYPRAGGGKCLNMASTAFSSFFSFFSGLLESASVAVPRHISFLVRPSKISTTSVPMGVFST